MTSTAAPTLTGTLSSLSSCQANGISSEQVSGGEREIGIFSGSGPEVEGHWRESDKSTSSETLARSKQREETRLFSQSTQPTQAKLTPRGRSSSSVTSHLGLMAGTMWKSK